jgi:hypothetical protein
MHMMFATLRAFLRRGSLFVCSQKLRKELSVKVILTHANLMLLKTANEFRELLLSNIESEWHDFYESYSDGEAHVEIQPRMA